MTINVDADIGNSDWTKRTWDVYASDGLVRTVRQLREVFPNDTDAQLKAMLKLPSAQGMPAQLKAELTLL